MGVNEQLNFGIVGVCSRGSAFKAAFAGVEEARVYALCDIDADGLARAAELYGADRQYVDYEAMLEDRDLDAVLIATPMHLHAPQAVAALSHHIHVLSEVTAAVSLDQCHELVAAAAASKATYMMGENYVYTKANSLVREMVKAGLFGTTYYGEGEYIHELKGLQMDTPWRRKWHSGINGVTYPTHSLGPLLTWMPGDRVQRLSCAGSGHHWNDLAGVPFEIEDTTLFIGKMQSGGLVKVRMDCLSDRPHATDNYVLQGTAGAYESPRFEDGPFKVWIRGRARHLHEWQDLWEFEAEYLPDYWRTIPLVALDTGHGCGDYFVIRKFVDAIIRDEPPEIGIHEAMDMTLPGLISQQSIAEDSRWLDVPDSRVWSAGTSTPFREDGR